MTEAAKLADELERKANAAGHEWSYFPLIMKAATALRSASDPDAVRALEWKETYTDRGQRGMQHFLDVVEDCDALAFLRFEDGYIGAGVAKEIECALRRGLMVFDASDGDLDPIENTMPDCVLTVEQTRAKIAYLRALLHDEHKGTTNASS